MRGRIRRIRERLDVQDLDWLIGLVILSAVAILALSTTGMSDSYEGNIDDVDRPPTNPIARALLDRTPKSDAADAEFATGNEDAHVVIHFAPLKESEKSLPLGADFLGRDVWMGVRLGSRTILIPGVLAALLSVLLGSILGVTEELAAKRLLRSICQSLRTILGAFPKFLVLLVVLGAGLGQRGGMLVFAAAVGVLGSARVAEAVRAQVVIMRQTDFLEACREIGLTQREIAFRHILNGVSRGLLLSLFIVGIADAILLEAMMTAFGWGLAGFSQATWANMLGDGFRDVPQLKLWTSIPPAVAIVILISGLYLLGNGLSRRVHLARAEG